MIERLCRAPGRIVFAMGLVCGLASNALAQAPPAATRPPDAVEVDPIRCWWQTSKGAVRMGEPFTLLLTCAVLDNDDVQVVPDESRLASSVIQMSPFEVMGGEHPADLRTPARRFFQYSYTLRVINPDLVGRDIQVPDVALHYRVSSRVSGNAALLGRDHTYLMPEQWVHVLSLVPFEASDIRDSPGSPFGAPESLTYRASLLRISAITFIVLGALMALVSLVRVMGQFRGRTAVSPDPLGQSGVKRLALRELAAVRRAVADEGWTDALVGRAAAATRLAGSLAVGRAITQRTAGDAVTGEGRVVARIPWRRFLPYAFSGSATTADIDQAIARAPASASARRRQALGDLRAALDAFTSVGYRPAAEFDREALDAALAQAVAGAQRVGVGPGWPLSLLRLWNTQTSGGGHAA